MFLCPGYVGGHARAIRRNMSDIRPVLQRLLETSCVSVLSNCFGVQASFGVLLFNVQFVATHAGSRANNASLYVIAVRVLLLNFIMVPLLQQILLQGRLDF